MADTKQETRREAAERIVELHRFEPGRWLWGARLCALCYKPFYYACHAPSFAQSTTIRNEDTK